MEDYRLTNMIISGKFSGESFHLMINDFRCAFAYWAMRQSLFCESNHPRVMAAVDAFTKFLQRRYFKNEEDVVKFDYANLEKIVSEDIFIAIPEVMALNETRPHFIDLGALARNVFYMIVRDQITQPL